MRKSKSEVTVSSWLTFRPSYCNRFVCSLKLQHPSIRCLDLFTQSHKFVHSKTCCCCTTDNTQTHNTYTSSQSPFKVFDYFSNIDCNVFGFVRWFSCNIDTSAYSKLYIINCIMCCMLFETITYCNLFYMHEYLVDNVKFLPLNNLQG